MENWDELSVTEQVLVRRAVNGTSPRGSATHVTAVLRWAGSPAVPRRRNASPAEESERVPELAAAVLRLVADGWLTVRRALSTRFVQEDGPAVTGTELERLVADPETWLLPRDERNDLPVLSLRATDEGRHRWKAAAYAPGVPATIHELELTEDEDRIRVCALEASGWLTGNWGVLADPPAESAGEELRAFVAAQIAPLVRFVRAGMIEVLHVPEPDAEGAVIPLKDLLDALCDRELRCDDRDDWGVGFTCILTESLSNALR
ncbi:hypothetical protein [Kitasatospora cheerisanensis]|uniref:Uncharacterized protein n=1 Tax=Kitasatospora cheerisanensis KCTC 2395 TaxID=1348663 RepID=A0A066Z418_9ACTN|nr:hypothetical protein [Kitasatospora cheerisanensis]KDN88212.1 hypothetical protein KCH_00620 [Kitasatospora cheerisanensis KCTC 2395]